jgi:DNA repair protein REV1
VAKVLYDTVAKYTLDIQAVSCDEMMVDLTELLEDCGYKCCDFKNILAQKRRKMAFCTKNTACLCKQVTSFFQERKKCW